jgi:cytochrome c oxidase subunit 2
MKKVFTLLSILLVLGTSTFAAGADLTKDPGYLSGEKLFKANCTTCHFLDKKMTGPALRGVTSRHREAWILKWVKNNSILVAARDPEAVALIKANNGAAMTVFENLTDADIKNIMVYVENGPPNPALPPAPAGATGAGSGTNASDTPSAWVFIILGILLFALLNLLISIENKVSKLIGKEVVNWNRINAIMFPVMLIAGSYYLYHYFSKYTPYTYFSVGSGSEHGKALDEMFMITLAITGFVFVLCQILIFTFPYFYRNKGPGTKAFYYPHNNKVEFWWTIIPSIVLITLLVYGLKTWNAITMQPKPQDAYEIELYARQFDWTVRYAGADGKLGKHNYHNIAGANTTGLEYKDVASHDDMMSQGEMHLIVNVPVVMHLRAQDVIHSAFIPNLRVQMNAVPGIPTSQIFTPIVTTKEMRARLQAEHPDDAVYNDWDYMLLCNKICGTSHYNMKMKVIIETRQEYEAWMKTLKSPYQSEYGVAPEVAPSDTTTNKKTASIIK